MPLNDTAFCGKCALKNNQHLFDTANIPLLYNYVEFLNCIFYILNVKLTTYLKITNLKMCFAYKIKSAITSITFVVVDLYGNRTNGLAYIQPIADFNWHYMCIDLYASLKTNNNIKTPKNQLTLISVIIQLKLNL